MKKEILKRLLATPGAEHTVSEFDTHFTGDLTKQEAYWLKILRNFLLCRGNCMHRTDIRSSSFFRQWMLPERTEQLNM